MLHALDCPGLVALPTVSGFYAQMTGVLAGFAFTALVVLLTPTQVDERIQSKARENGVTLTLVGAFIALVIATLNYSILAGETAGADNGRAAAEELVDAIPFALAVMMLFHGITLLMQSGNVDRVAVWSARAVTVVAAPSLGFYYICSGAQDTETARAALAGTCTSPPLPSGSAALDLALPMLLSAALIPKLYPDAVKRHARKLQAAVPITVLVTSVAAAVFIGNLSTKRTEFLLSPSALTAYLASTFALFALLGITLAIGYPSSQHDIPRAQATNVTGPPAAWPQVDS